MKKNTYLEFSLHPSFLSEPLPKVSTNSLLFSEMHKLFGDLKIPLQNAQANKDHYKALDPKAYTDTAVEFTPKDEDEINRSDSYRFSPDLPEVLSTENAKLCLSAMGVEDVDMQNFILQLFLQNRIGIHYGLLGILGIIPHEFSKSHMDVLASSDHDRKLSIKYDSFFNQVKLFVTSTVTYNYDGSHLYVGQARLALTIASNLEIRIKDLYYLLKPLNEISMYHGSNKVVTNYEKYFHNLSNALAEYSSMSLNSIEPSTSGQAEVAGEPLCSIDPGPNASGANSFSLTNRVKSLFFQDEVKQESKDNPVDTEVLQGLFNRDKHDPPNIDSYTFYPSCVVHRTSILLNNQDLHRYKSIKRIRRNDLQAAKETTPSLTNIRRSASPYFSGEETGHNSKTTKF